MHTYPLVSIQILNWNRADETVRAIKSALNQTYNNIEIIIIDNGSTDDSIEKIEINFPNLKLIKLDKNYGCPGGRNRGTDYCNGEYIFFCDNDGVLHSEAVYNAVNIANQDSKISVVTGHVKDFTNEIEIDTNFRIHNYNIYKTTIFQGGICLVKKSVFTNIDKYPEDYMYGAEETYLSLRILDAGKCIVKSTNVILWHKKSEKARDLVSEALNGFGNTLSNAYQLYPLLYFIIYCIYFCTVYPYYAYKYKFLYEFLINIPAFYRKILRYQRRPVKYKTYKDFKKFKNNNV